MLDRKSDQELLQSLLEEVAKTNNEIKCATQDLRKAQNRIGFILVLANILINRKRD